MYKLALAVLPPAVTTAGTVLPEGWTPDRSDALKAWHNWITV